MSSVHSVQSMQSVQSVQSVKSVEQQEEQSKGGDGTLGGDNEEAGFNIIPPTTNHQPTHQPANSQRPNLFHDLKSTTS